MVERYPDTIVIKVKSEPTQDENGNLIEGTLISETVKSRVKPSGERWIVGDNGKLAECNFTVSCDILSTDYSGGEVDFAGKTYPILRFISNYQNRSKIFLGGGVK